MLHLNINVSNVISSNCSVLFWEEMSRAVALMLHKVAQDLLAGRLKLIMFGWFIVGYSKNVNSWNLFVHAGLTSWLSEQHHSNKRKHKFRTGCFSVLTERAPLCSEGKDFYFTNWIACTSQHGQLSIRYSSRLFLVWKVALFCIKSLCRLTEINSKLMFL